MHRIVVALALAACSQPASHRDDVRAQPRAAPTSGVSGDARAEVNNPIADVIRDAPVADTPVDAVPLAIVDAPMTWSAERERLTLAYRRTHTDPAAADLAIEPRVIVLHYTGGHSAAATRAYFDRVTIEPGRRQLARGGKVNVSAHFVIDRDGTIYRLQPVTRYARHCIGLDHIAIGIENVGDGERYPLTAAQVAANAALVRQLAGQFRITHLLGHHEVMQFRDHPYFVERVASYHNVKADPGAAFMASVRERVADLGLAGL